MVIANPPYVRQESIINEKEYYKSYKTYHGMADIYTYFLEKSVGNIKYLGFLCFIVSNRFTHTNYGKRLREYLASNKILKLINFNNTEVFESANVDTLVISVKKDNAEKTTIYICNVNQDYKKDSQLEHYLKENYFLSESKYYSEKQWSFYNSDILELKKKIEDIGEPLKDGYNVKINRGITTGLNSVFVIDEIKKNEIISRDINCKDMLKPILRGGDIKSWYTREPTNYLIYSISGIEIKKYPAVYEYLNIHKSELEEVYEAKHGKKMWYELRGCNYYSAFEKEKIMYTRLGKRNSFTVISKNEFCLDSAGIINSSDNYYLCGILNSSVILFYFKLVGVIWGKDGIKWFGNSFDNLPIYKINKNSARDIRIRDYIKSIVDQILIAKKTNHEADTTALEAEIDRLVYELYGLTEEEIRLVEESVAN